MMFKNFGAPIITAIFVLCILSATCFAASQASDPGKSALTHRDAAKQARQVYPSRPVRFIIPFPPAGGTDIVGRILGEKLGDKLGQQFVIDNRPGAAGTLGSGIAAKAAADGYTIVLVTASFAISASFYRNLPYDPVRDFDAVGFVASQPAVLVIHPSVPATSVKELIALVRANPDKLNYASGGAGGINHLAAEMLNSMTGMRVVHIPYKGLGPALTALLAGEVQLMIATLGSSLPLIRSGKLRALALGAAKRSSSAPDLATLAESGVPGYDVDNWYGVLAPRGTPQSIIGLLNGQTVAVLAGADVRDRFAALGFEPAASTPKQFADYLKAEIAKWAKVVRESGAKAE